MPKSPWMKLLESQNSGAIPCDQPVLLKRMVETAYWRRLYAKNRGNLGNAHYLHFYTGHFGIDLEEYRDRRILDIGCGPRGSLEWAGIAKERVGIDPLVDQYRRLGINAHGMHYINAASEQIPFPDEYWDFVSCFNALDHVDEVDATLSEIARVLKHKGIFLLITEINHPPTTTEPHVLTKNLLDLLSQTFFLTYLKYNSIRSDHDIYQSLREDLPAACSGKSQPSILSARLVKRQS